MAGLVHQSSTVARQGPPPRQGVVHQRSHSSRLGSKPPPAGGEVGACLDFLSMPGASLEGKPRKASLIYPKRGWSKTNSKAAPRRGSVIPGGQLPARKRSSGGSGAGRNPSRRWRVAGPWGGYLRLTHLAPAQELDPVAGHPISGTGCAGEKGVQGVCPDHGELEARVTPDSGSLGPPPGNRSNGQPTTASGSCFSSSKIHHQQLSR